MLMRTDELRELGPGPRPAGENFAGRIVTALVATLVAATLVTACRYRSPECSAVRVP